jgi:hypothetical protein
LKTPVHEGVDFEHLIILFLDHGHILPPIELVGADIPAVCAGQPFPVRGHSQVSAHIDGRRGGEEVIITTSSKIDRDRAFGCELRQLYARMDVQFNFTTACWI